MESGARARMAAETRIMEERAWQNRAPTKPVDAYANVLKSSRDGSEAVLPADLKFRAPRLIFENIAEAEATRLEDVDVLEEERLNMVIQSARYQQTLRRYHDKAIRHRSFAVRDLVLRRILTGEGRHKLSPLWEGPFIIAEVTRTRSYRLTQMAGTKIGNS
jgi:hypothetical protein